MDTTFTVPYRRQVTRPARPGHETADGGPVEKREYEAPVVLELGAVRDLTAQNKCGGSGDSLLPQLALDPLSTNACPTSP
jgi:hypothetical protein